MPLAVPEHVAPDALHLNDVIYVNITEGKNRSDAKAELRIRPKVQGATVVLENKTGRILAMVGGFSYPLSQLNRTSQALRQPGSSIKPLTYLAALHGGLQPNTLVLDAPVTLPPIPGVTTHSWTPKNYDGSELGLDHAAPRAGELEEPRHRAPARRRHRQGPDQEPGADLRTRDGGQDLSRVHQELSVRARRPAAADDRSRRLLCRRSSTKACASRPTRSTRSSRTATPSTSTRPARRTCWRTATARRSISSAPSSKAWWRAAPPPRCKHLAHFVGGKTGTTENENDAWFVGFTSDVTVAVWVGYDNARGKQTLGSGETGGKVAVPIAEPIIQATWNLVGPKTPLPPPSAEAARHLKAMPIDYASGQRLAAGSGSGFTEYFKLDGNKKVRDTQYALAGRHSLARGEPRPDGRRCQAPGPRQTPTEERPQYVSPSAGGRLPPSDRVPRNLRELFGM